LHSHDNTEKIYVVDGNVQQVKGNMLPFCGNAVGIFVLLTVTCSSTVHFVGFHGNSGFVNVL
jgi:hypothetical protein